MDEFDVRPVTNSTELSNSVAAVAVPTSKSRRAWIIAASVTGALLVVAGIVVAVVLVLPGSTTPTLTSVSPTSTNTPTVTVTNLTPTPTPRTTVTITPVPSAVTVQTFVPAYLYIPFGDTIFVRDPSNSSANGFIYPELKLPSAIRKCVLGPNLDRLYALGTQVYVVDVIAATTLKLNLNLPISDTSDLVVTPDNKYLYVATSTGYPVTFSRVEIATMNISSVTAKIKDSDAVLLGQAPTQVSLSRDGSYLYAFFSPRQVARFVLNTWPDLKYDIFVKLDVFVDVPGNVVALRPLQNTDSTISLSFGHDFNKTDRIAVYDGGASIKEAVQFTAPTDVAIPWTAFDINATGTIAYVGFQTAGKPTLASFNMSTGAEIGRTVLDTVTNAVVNTVFRVGDRLFVGYGNTIVDVPLVPPFTPTATTQKTTGNIASPAQGFVYRTVNL